MDDATPVESSDEREQVEDRIDDLRLRLEEAALEAIAQRERYEVAAGERDDARARLDAVTQELALVRASRAYQVAERIRRLLRR
jgi:hypothetical protein